MLKEQARLADRVVVIKNTLTQEEIAVQAVQGAGMTVELRNLPPEVDVYSYNYTSQEKWENYKEVIECLVTMHATLSGAISETPDGSDEQGPNLPSAQAFQ